MRILFVLPGIDGGGVGQIVYNYISHINKEKFICALYQNTLSKSL